MRYNLFTIGLLLTGATVHAQTSSELRHMAAARHKADSIAATYGQYSNPTTTKLNHKNDKLDYNNGFRNYHFGENIAMHASELKLAFQDGNVKVYERKNENLKAGYATLKSISYIYTSDKLSSVIIKLTGQANSDLIKLAFFEQFGFTEPSNYAPNRYSWQGGKVSLDFKGATLDNEEAQAMYVGLKP